MTWEYRVLWEWRFFLDKISAWELRVFTELTVFWQNMGMRALIFLWKSRKKRASYWLFGPLWSVVLTELTFFWPIMCMMAGGFSWEIFKNDIRAPCFWEKKRFLTKYGHQIYVFLDIGFFWTKFRRKSSHFFVKSRKKLHPIDFFGPQFPYIIAVLTELAFFWFMGENGE